MENLMDRLMRMCFENDSVYRIVRSSLPCFVEHENSQTVKPLQLLALRSILQHKIGKDLCKNIIFKLVNREPLLLKYFDPSQYSDPESGDFTDYQELIGDPLEVFGQLRKDPYVVLAALEQNIFSQCWPYVYLMVRRNSLSVLAWYNRIGEIPNRENVEFDTFWAEKFMRTLLKMRLGLVDLQMEGGHVLDHAYMRAHLNELLSLYSKEVPPEGWEQAIKDGRRLLWQKGHHDTWTDGTFHAQYMFATEFDTLYLPMYRCFHP